MWMKIITGIYKGMVLKGFDIEGTRPTTSRVKESLFAMIQDYIKESVVLDLFSGSGNLGIEALSMGANKAYFVDKNRLACKVINSNIAKLNIKQGVVINSDYKKALKSFEDDKVKFNIIFLDPPYNSDYINNSLNLIDKYNLVNKEGIIVCESNDLKRIDNGNYEKFKERKYGDKWIVILKKI